MAHYTQEQRDTIVSDYLKSNLSLPEYAQAHGKATLAPKIAIMAPNQTKTTNLK